MVYLNLILLVGRTDLHLTGHIVDFDRVQYGTKDNSVLNFANSFINIVLSDNVNASNSDGNYAGLTLQYLLLSEVVLLMMEL